MDHSVLYPLVESASGAIASDKPEMQAYLASMQRNWLDENYPQQDQEMLTQVRNLLDNSPDLPTFMQAYKGLAVPQTMVSAPIAAPSAQEQSRSNPSSKPSDQGSGNSSEAPHRPVFNKRRRTRTK